MMPVLMMTASSGGVASTQSSPTFTCRPGSGGAWQRCDQVDVAVLGGPDMAVRCEIGHRRITDRPGQGWPVGDHVVEERLVATDALGDHPEKSSLQIGDRLVETVEHLGDAGNRVFGSN